MTTIYTIEHVASGSPCDTPRTLTKAKEVLERLEENQYRIIARTPKQPYQITYRGSVFLKEKL